MRLVSPAGGPSSHAADTQPIASPAGAAACAHLRAPPGPWDRARREPFSFTGTASEYFGIWIVNVLLTILTLGIYSAWAKVRRMRYFYGSTHLAGASFGYHAKPKQILIGRIIVLVLLSASDQVLSIPSPAVGIAALALIVIATPWFIYRGLRFSARVTSYQNVRFDFTGTYGGAFKAYVLGTLVAYSTLTILAPLASRWQWQYSLNNLKYGGRSIATDPRLGALFPQWFAAIGVTLVPTAIVIFAFFAVFASAWDEPTDPVTGIAQILLILFAVLAYWVAFRVYSVGSRNVAMNATVIDDRHRMVSAIGRHRYVWITVTNLLATIMTLGLARPWAAIRMAKYMSTVTALDVDGSLQHYVSTVKDSGGAVGSEYMDMEGFDFGF